MWEKVSVFIKLVWKVSLKRQINEIINTRIKQPVFLSKDQRKTQSYFGKRHKKGFQEGIQDKGINFPPYVLPLPAFIPEFQNLQKRHTIKAGHENKH